MTKPMMDLRSVVEMRADADLLREMIGFVAERLPEMDSDKPKKQRFKRYPIRFSHVDIAELWTAEGKHSLFVAIDRTSKLAVAQPVGKANRKTAREFREHLLQSVP